jgi:hypothetical protein
MGNKSQRYIEKTGCRKLRKVEHYKLHSYIAERLTNLSNAIRTCSSQVGARISHKICVGKTLKKKIVWKTLGLDVWIISEQTLIIWSKRFWARFIFFGLREAWRGLVSMAMKHQCLQKAEYFLTICENY